MDTIESENHACCTSTPAATPNPKPKRRNTPKTNPTNSHTLTTYFLALSTLRPPTGASACTFGAALFPAAFTGASFGTCPFFGAGAAAAFPPLTVGARAWTLEDLGERMVDGGGGGALERDAARARARDAVRVAGAGAGGGGCCCCLERGGAVREAVRFAGGADAGAGAGAGAGFGLVRFLGLGRAA